MEFHGQYSVKLSVWAKQYGISYKTAWKWFRDGKLPVKAEQSSTGTIVVFPEHKAGDADTSPTVVLYGRVSSHDQKEDLERQMDRLRSFAYGKGWTVSKEVKEIGSGLNGNRKKLLDLLRDQSYGTIVVEHRDRLARFGSEMIEAALMASGRKVVVVNQTENKTDIVQDFVSVATSLCARIYGKRSAANRARKALEATK